MNSVNRMACRRLSRIPLNARGRPKLLLCFILAGSDARSCPPPSDRHAAAESPIDASSSCLRSVSVGRRSTCRTSLLKFLPRIFAEFCYPRSANVIRAPPDKNPVSPESSSSLRDVSFQRRLRIEIQMAGRPARASSASRRVKAPKPREIPLSTRKPQRDLCSNALSASA